MTIKEKNEIDDLLSQAKDKLNERVTEITKSDPICLEIKGFIRAITIIKNGFKE